MIIRDIFLLERSEEFELAYREEVTVNLCLKEVPIEPITTITGKIFDKEDNPIEGATVKVFSLKYKPIEHVTTDTCGGFLFKNIILPGIYYVIATAPGFRVSKSYRVIVK